MSMKLKSCVTGIVLSLCGGAVFAQTDALVVDDTGRIGVGTAAPANPLHVVRSDGTGQIKVTETNTGSNVRTLFNLICEKCTPAFRFQQVSPAAIWFFRMLQSGDFSIDYQGQSGTDVTFKKGGNMKILGSLTEGSSRSSKQDIEAIDTGAVLDKLASLPLAEWSYKHDGSGVRHVGPMAEDFHATFGLGENGKGISPIDTGGIALAAVQELYRMAQQKDEEIAELQAGQQAKQEEISALKLQLAEVQEQQQRIEVLEKVLATLVVRESGGVSEASWSH